MLRTTPKLVAACLLVAGITPIGAAAGDPAADPALAQAEELERAGETHQAADAYRAWLEAHPSPRDAATGQLYVGALLRLGRVEPDARLYQHLLEAAPLDKLPEGARKDLLLAQAELLDDVGELDRAQEAYARAAASEIADPQAAGRLLLRSAALLYELGRIQEAEARANEVLASSGASSNGPLAASAMYLAGRMMAATGRPEDALRTWSAVLQTYPFTPAAASACYGIYALTLALGRTSEAQEALSVLSRLYPDSPELAMASEAGAVRTVPAPRPTTVLEPYLAFAYSMPAVESPAAEHSLPSGEAAQPAQAPPQQEPDSGDLVVVLTGSYTRRENAERNCSLLVARGFAARIVEVDVGGKRYYRVLVGDPTTRDQALALSQKLKDRDVESSLIAVAAGVD